MTVRLYDDITPNQNIILDLPFFEGAGTRVHDLSRQHNNGNFVAGHLPTWVQLASGIWVLDFNNDHYILMPDSPLWALAQLDFSFEVWFNPDFLDSQTLMSQGNGGAPDTNNFTFNDGFTFEVFPPGGSVTSPNAATIGCTIGAWNHIVITRSAVNTWLLYCNRNAFAMTGVTGLTIPNYTSGLYLGTRYFVAAGLNNLMGRLSRPRLYLNHALTPAEVVSHYTAERVLYP